MTVQYVCRCCGGYGAHETAFVCQEDTDDCFCVALTGPVVVALDVDRLRDALLAEWHRDHGRLSTVKLSAGYGHAWQPDPTPCSKCEGRLRVLLGAGADFAAYSGAASEGTGTR